jgi:WD40-like Beta Propeller Repeat
MGKLFEELKRRKVFRVAAVYAVVAWLIVQVVGAIADPLNLPDWFATVVIVSMGIGFPLAIILAWAYELTPDGIRADTLAQQPHVITQGTDRKLIYAILVLVLLAVGFQVADRFLAPTRPSTVDPAMLAAARALPETRVELVTPATNNPIDFALSPDGRQIVFVASDDSGTSQLWLRSLSNTTAQPLPGTDGASRPFWSSDGRAIGFFTGSALQRIDTAGGAPQTLAPITFQGGGTWTADNTLLFAPFPNGHLMRVSATGGESSAVTTLEPGQTAHWYPFFLPDGQQFLFYSRGTPETMGIYLGHLDGSAPVRLTAADFAGAYHPDGWLLWVRAGTLTAQRLDLAQAALTGETVTLADGLATDGHSGGAGWHAVCSLAVTGRPSRRGGTDGARQSGYLAAGRRAPQPLHV